MSSPEAREHDEMRELLQQETVTAFQLADELAVAVEVGGLAPPERAADLAAQYLESRRTMRRLRASLAVEGVC